MSKNESQSQKLNEIFKNISNILTINNNNSKDTIKKLLNNYLTSIINNKKEFNNFFTSLNSFIFTSKSEEGTKYNKDLFVIYPIIYSFNQKITINYIDHFLNTLKQAVKDQNQSDFSFLSSIFTDIINCFFNNKDNNSNCIDNKLKEILYKKIFSYINEMMKTNENIAQSFGCLLLSEFIEKCPLVKDKNNLGPLFKDVSLYLEDNKFECTIDLLNCIITLILTVGKKFKSYVNVCLFRILDYLTDNDWIKRKLAINIVYIMTFYCKEEIMVVKENIIEFLDILKEDNVKEIREVCLETLKIIDGRNTNDINKIIKYLDLSEEKKSNILNKSHLEQSEIEKNNTIKNTDIKIKKRINDNDNISENIKNLQIKKIESYESGINFSDLNKGKTNSKNKINNNNNVSQSNKKINIVINEQIKNGSTSTNSLKIPSKINKKQNNRNKINLSINNIIENYMNINLNTSYSITNNTELSERKINPRLNKSTEQRTTNNLNKRNIKKDNSKNVKKQDTNQELLEEFQKEKLLFQEIEKQINDKKPKKSPLPSSTNKKIKSNHKSNNSKNMKIKKITDIQTKKEQEKTNTQKNEENDNEIKYKESIDITSNYNVTDTNINMSEKKDDISTINNNDDNISESNTNKILEQFNIIQEKQNNIIKMINNLKDTVDMNYMVLNKRINTLEKYIINFNILNNSNEENQLDDEMKFETIKKKYINGKYNEALTEAKQNDKYLYKLLPLISVEKIPNIDISIIDDIIFILCIKLPGIQVGQNNIHTIISFLNQVIRSKISLKSYIKNKIKDTLKFMKIENNLKLSQSDIVNIDNILRTIEL